MHIDTNMLLPSIYPRLLLESCATVVVSLQYNLSNPPPFIVMSKLLICTSRPNASHEA